MNLRISEMLALFAAILLILVHPAACQQSSCAPSQVSNQAIAVYMYVNGNRNFDCTYQIMMSAGMAAKIVYTYVNMLTSDYVQFYDGPSIGSPLLAECTKLHEFSSLQPPTCSEIRSTQPNVTMRFRTFNYHVGYYPKFYATVQEIDMDECSIDNGGCAHNCRNVRGSFNCGCNRGYQLMSDGRGCVDIDECETKNGGCSHNCLNSAGTYQCSCETGFILKIDKHQCEDIDECLVRNGGCEQTCENLVGGYECSCHPGYLLKNDKHNCLDVDECEESPGPCDSLYGVCLNSLGNYSCDCIMGYKLDHQAINHTCIAEGFLEGPWRGLRITMLTLNFVLIAIVVIVTFSRYKIWATNSSNQSFEMTASDQKRRTKLGQDKSEMNPDNSKKARYVRSGDLA